jgi:hypothetical protein
MPVQAGCDGVVLSSFAAGRLVALCRLFYCFSCCPSCVFFSFFLCRFSAGCLHSLFFFFLFSNMRDIPLIKLARQAFDANF